MAAAYGDDVVRNQIFFNSVKFGLNFFQYWAQISL